MKVSFTDQHHWLNVMWKQPGKLRTSPQEEDILLRGGTQKMKNKIKRENEINET